MASDTLPHPFQQVGGHFSVWRPQEYVLLSFYTVYVYYCFTTIDEEVTVIHSQRWGIGRIVFLVLRYANLLHININLATAYPTYFQMSPMACKGFYIATDILYGVVNLGVSAVLSLCLSALLQLGPTRIVAAVFFGDRLSCCLLNSQPCGSDRGSITALRSKRQLAQEVGLLDKALGYPCYAAAAPPASDTVASTGRGIRTYVNFAEPAGLSGGMLVLTLIFLVRHALVIILAITVYVYKYREVNGKLVHVLGRDGGLCYLIMTVAYLVAVFVCMPPILSSRESSNSPAYLATMGLQVVVIPILIQRLLIGMRAVDDMGSRPQASTLLFAEVHDDSELSSLEDGRYELDD